MGNIGFPEILMVLVVALIVFGPRKLPELGKSLGAGLREFRRSTQGLKEEFEGAMNHTDLSKTAQPAQVQVISAQPQVVVARDVAAQPVSVAAAEAVAVPATPTPKEGPADKEYGSEK